MKNAIREREAGREEKSSKGRYGKKTTRESFQREKEYYREREREDSVLFSLDGVVVLMRVSIVARPVKLATRRQDNSFFNKNIELNYILVGLIKNKYIKGCWFID